MHIQHHFGSARLPEITYYFTIRIWTESQFSTYKDHLPYWQEGCHLSMLFSGTLQFTSLLRQVCLLSSKRGLKCKQISHSATWCAWSGWTRNCNPLACCWTENWKTVAYNIIVLLCFPNMGFSSAIQAQSCPMVWHHQEILVHSFTKPGPVQFWRDHSGHLA